MSEVTVRVTYVDGTEARCDADAWCSQRADGVDQVMVANRAGPVTFQGCSAYWLYREGSTWVAGQASFGYSSVLTPEVIFTDDTQVLRYIEYVPDLAHSDIKLGWFRPGEEKPPWPALTT